MKTTYKLITLAVASALLTACASGGGGSGGNGAGTGGSGINTNSVEVGAFKALSKEDKTQADGSNVYVGIVDTGVNTNSVGLQGKNVSKKTIEGNNLVDSKDGFQHGTVMAEIVTQVAPNAAINSGGNSTGNYVSSNVGLDNLLRAMEVGAKVDIVNNSYSIPVSSDVSSEAYGANNEKIIEENKINGKYYQEFVERGALLLMATGNQDKRVATIYSALPVVNSNLEPGFIAVTAYNQKTASKTQNDCGVAMNWCVTAPEVYDVYGNNSEKTGVAGTSSATAFVSGLSAKIKSRYDWYTNQDLKNTILTTAEDKGAAGVDSVWGHGLVNADKALGGYGRFNKQQVLNVDGTKKAYFFDNDISGQGGLTKKGKDILVMNGNNTYTGDTIIEQGELIANGNSVSRHRVKSGAVLSIGDSANEIKLGAVDNQGALNVDSANLVISGNLNGTNGTINQAIGTKITVNGSANLSNATYKVSGVKNGYITKAGTTEVLLSASNSLNSSGLTTQFSNSTVGELVNQRINVGTNEISVTTSRRAIGDVVRSQTDFTGRDRTVANLDGLLDKIDASKLPKSVNYNYTDKTGLSIAQALLSSQNLSETLFSLSTETAKHAQEQSVRNKALRGDTAISYALSAKENGYIWVDTGYGKTEAKDLVGIKGESQDNTQTLGWSKNYGKHGLALQLDRVSNKWTESYQNVSKDTTLTGYGFEAAYSYNQGKFWAGANIGYDRMKAETAYGLSKGNQYNIGVSLGKWFDLGKFSLMPTVGLKYSQLSNLDYVLGKVNDSYISADNAKTRELAAILGLDSFWKVDGQGKLTLNLGVKAYQVLSGKTTFQSNFGGYVVDTEVKATGKRPDINVYAGANYQATDALRIYMNGGFEKGKYRDRKHVNIGLGLSF